MAKKEAKSEKSGTGMKIGKILLWIFAVIGILIILLVVWVLVFNGSDNNVSEINSLWNEYDRVFDLFSKEYGVASPGDVTSLAVLPRALAGLENAQRYLLVLEANATQVTEKISSVKEKYDGDQLEWLNSVEECYTGELARIKLYEEILENERAYFKYYESDKNYDKTYEEFIQLLASASSLTTDQESITWLNNAKAKVVLLKGYAESAYAAIPFTYYQKTIVWATKYIEGTDFGLQYTASPSQELYKQMNDKYTEAANALQGVTKSAVEEEFDKWYNEKITLKQDEVDRTFNQLNNDCKNANSLFATAFPGNANVIAEINASA